MSALTDNHFAVLTAVAAPAILTNASSVLCLGLGNRIARVIDRTRAVAIAMAGEASGSELRKHLEYEFALLRRRARFLTYSLRLGYAALGGFAAEALTAVLGGLLAYSPFAHLSTATAIIALLIGILSVGAFVVSCTYMVRETVMALENLESEANTLMLHTMLQTKKRA